MRKKCILFFVLCLAGHTLVLSQENSTMVSILKSTVWEHGNPDFGDYRQLVFTDSTTYYKSVIDDSGLRKREDRKYYLTDRVEYAFDNRKVGKTSAGTYVMTKNDLGGIMCYKIKSLSKTLFEWIPIHLNGRENDRVVWSYTPLKR